MANEINIQASLTFQRYIPIMQGSGNLNINQTNKYGIFNVQNITNTGNGEQLSALDVTNLGYLFVKNLDATNYVQLAIDASFTQLFAKLRPGEFCLLPTNVTTMPYAKANTAPCDVLVCAVDL